MTVTDSKGCSVIASVTITEPVLLTATAVQDNPVVCNGESNGTATVTAADGNGGYSYLWDDNETTATATALNAGTHTVTVTDSKGCSVIATVTITEPVLLTATAVQDNPVVCNGESNGSATVTAADGNGGYSYLWDDNETTATATALNAGTHTVTVTDSKGCSVIASVTITEPVLLTASAVQNTPVVCNGESNGSATVTASDGNGGYSYLWDDNETTATATALNAGTHTVTVTDSKGCSVIASVTIDEPVLLTATAVQDNPVVCNGESNGTATVTAADGNGGYSYLWDDNETTATATALNAGTHSVTVTDSKGCTATASVTITEPVLLTASAVQNTPVVCNGESNGTATVTAADGNGGYSYLWDDNETTATATALNAGTHTVTVTDSKGCSVIASVTIDEPDVISVSDVSQSTIGCNGETATVSITAAGGTGILHYTFDGETNTTGVFTHAAGTGLAYSVTDDNNCAAATGTFDVVQPDVISVSDVSQSPISCNGGTATVTITAAGGTGTLHYTFDGITNTTGIFTHAAGTDLPYSITDDNNCAAATGTFDVVEPDALNASVASTDVSCNGANDGTITITAPTGGYGNYEYSVDGGTTWSASNSFTALPAATYNVQMRDADNPDCVKTLNPVLLITEPGLLSATIAGTAAICQNGPAQTITLANPMALPVIITYSVNDGTNTTTATVNVNGGGTATVMASTAMPGTFTYTILSVQYQGTQGCSNAVTGQSAVITVSANSTISLTTAAETAAQNVCINFPIEDIIYMIGGGGTGVSVTGALPAGVTFGYNATTHLFTITGSPSQTGTYNYTVTTMGICNNVSLSGTITVSAGPTITALPAGSENQTVCQGTAIGAINFTVGGSATGAVVAGLPDGLTGSYAGGVFTISGTPNVSSTFAYTIITTGGPCTDASIDGTITVNASSTISLSSSVQSAAQTICITNPIDPITYAIDGGSTGASVTGLPPGVTGSFPLPTDHEGTFTISGTPTAIGTYNYTITTQGPCNNPSLSGTITVGGVSTISLSSPALSDAQAVCINNNINTISYAIGGGATGASITAGQLPAGVSGLYSAGVFTISGTPTQSGNFSYTVTATGPCTSPSLGGTITVNPAPVVNGIQPVTYCNNASGSEIDFSSPNAGVTYQWTSTANVGFGLSGTLDHIPSFTAANTTNSPVTATVSVTATGSSCTGAATTFTVTVNPTPVVNSVTAQTYCSGGTGSVSFVSPTTGGTVTYSWSSDINVGFGLSGNGDIGPFTATNNTAGAITANVTVKPYFNGCGGSSKTFTITVYPNSAGTISGGSTICSNTTTQLTTNGIAGGSWTSSNTAAATVDPSSGLVTGVAAGNTTITYSVSGTCGTSTSTFNVTVNAAAVAGTISGPSTVCVNSTILLSTSGSSGGTWFTTSSGLVSVNPLTGAVTGVAAGSATIYYLATSVSCGTQLSLPYTITVVPGGGSAGSIVGASSVCPGSFTFLTTTGDPSGTWSSSNTSIASVFAAVPGGALIQAVAAGSTTITYTVPASACGSGSSTSITFTVNAVGNTGTLGGLTSVCANSTIQLTTTLPGGGLWYSGTPGVASVNSFGVVSGVGQGTATIYYSVPNSCGGATESVNVTVSPQVTAGTISGPGSVCVNSTINLLTSGTPGGSWETSDHGVAVVDGSGVVKGIGAGTATITYTPPASVCTAIPSATASVIVNPLPVAGTVSDTTICNGSSTTFASSGGTGGGSWSSSNTAVATVNPTTGVALAVGPGSTIITYTVTSGSGCGNGISRCITVKPVLNAGTISGGTSVCAGSTLNLSASGNTGGTWSSSNTV